MSGVILLSAGLDSTVAMAMYLKSEQAGIALTIDYGQRAAKQEITRAGCLAAHYGLEHTVVKLPFLAQVTRTSLVNRDASVPEVDAADLDRVLDVTLRSAEKVWVPNRNGLFINLAAALAESREFNCIVAGFNAEEAATFPDNSPQFVIAANQALAFSTLNQVKVISPTQNLNKMEIVRMGLTLNIPWQHLWSCYHGGDKMCGRCESCSRLKRALESQAAAKELNVLFSE